MNDKQSNEGARRGSTAQQKADRLRVKAERLSRQADAWVVGAEREPAVAKKLKELPREYAVLQDVIIPGTSSRCDFVVLGSGGIYVVDAKKYSGRLVYSGKMLWHGRFPITEKLENVQWEADCLSDALGRPVVPVLCFVDQVLPQPVTTLGSVIVCRISSLMTVVRSSHTMISPADITRIVGALTASDTAASNGDVASIDPDDPLLDVDLRPASTYSQAGSQAGSKAGFELAHGPRREPRPRRVRHALKVLAICLLGLAVAVGAVMLFSSWLNSRNDDAADEAPTTTIAATSTTAEASTTTSVPDEPVQLQFNAVCPEPGIGWSMVPVWPGTIENVAYYEFAVQAPADGSWVPFGVMTSPDPGALALAALAAGEQRIVRATPALTTGVAGEPIFTLVAAPADPC